MTLTLDGIGNGIEILQTEQRSQFLLGKFVQPNRLNNDYYQLVSSSNSARRYNPLAVLK